MKRMISIILTLFLALPCIAVGESVNLIVAGESSTITASGFTALNPEITVQTNGDYFRSTKEMVGGLMTGSAAYDVFILTTDMIDARQIFKKDFAYPLTDSLAISQAVSQMYSFTREWSTLGDQVYALPLEISSQEPYCHLAYFEALGLQVPDSWEKVAQMINDWPELPSDAREAYSVGLWVTNYRQWFLRQIMRAYTTYYEASGQPLTFDTPSFRALMELADSLTTENDTVDENDYSAEELEPLIDTIGDALRDLSLDSAPLLSIPMNGEIYYGAYLKLAIVNPNSKHLQEAVQFVEYLAENPGDIDRFLLYDETHIPVENDIYEQLVNEWEEEKARLEEILKNSKDENLYQNKFALDEHLASKEYLERGRYIISQALIDAYAPLPAKITVLGPGLLRETDSSGVNFSDVLEARYLSGDITSDAFIAEWERIAQMIAAENAS